MEDKSTADGGKDQNLVANLATMVVLYIDSHIVKIQRVNRLQEEIKRVCLTGW